MEIKNDKKRISIKALSGSEPHCSHLKVHCELQLTSSSSSLEHDVISLNVHTVHCELQLTSSSCSLEHDVIPFDASVHKFDMFYLTMYQIPPLFFFFFDK